MTDFKALVRFWKQLQAGLEGLGNLNFRLAMGEFGALGQKSLCRVIPQMSLGSVLESALPLAQREQKHPKPAGIPLPLMLSL